MRRPALLALLVASAALADEGMWTFDNFPSEKVKQKYGFGPDQAWLDHVRLSSVRLAEGCSGSFVSPSGLVMTNHHCSHRCIEELSTAQKDFTASGFYAAAPAQEVKCPTMEVNQLTALTDVTGRVGKATVGTTGEAFDTALKKILAQIEAECAGGNDHVRCEVVKLYNGGKYVLHTWHRYQDVRLVF